jgi:predicted RNA-binding Zn ribbon-like protein
VIVQGNSVLVPFSTAEKLATWMRASMTERERRNCVPFDPDEWHAVREFEAVATRHVAQNVAGATGQTAAKPILVEVSTKEAAEIEGVSEQAIRARIKRKTLPARPTKAGHRINIENLRTKETING